MRDPFKTSRGFFMPTKAMTLDTTRRHLEDLLLAPGAAAIPIRLVATEKDLAALGDMARRFVEARGWKAKHG